MIILYVYYFKLYSDFPGSDLAPWSQVHLIESDENECEFYSYVAVNSFEFVAHDIYVNLYSGMLSEVLW